LNGCLSRSSAEIIHAGLEAFLPAVKMHTCQLPDGGTGKMNVQTLALVNVCTAISGQVDNLLLTDLPHSFVDRFDIGRDIRDILDGATVSNDHVLHVIVPKPKRNEFLHQPRVGNLELSCQNPACIDVARVRLEALIKPENLARAGSRHRSNQ